MNLVDQDETILVFTYKDKNTILKFGGSQSWVLNAKRAKKCKYIICSHNCHNPMSEEKKGHGSGFIIGKISDIRPAFYYPKRWLIEIDEYAEINLPNLWEGWRNPVVYLPRNKIKLDLLNLNYKKTPPRDTKFVEEHMEREKFLLGNLPKSSSEHSSSKTNINSSEGLSMQEAKQGLSIRYDVSPDNIEIIIKG